MQALGKSVHVSKEKFVNEIKQHRQAYAEQETEFNTWKAPNGEIYLVPEFRSNKESQKSGEQLGYLLSMKENDELAKQSLVAVKEENITALGFPFFWKSPCEEEEEEEEEEPPRKITIILDGIDAKMSTEKEESDESNNLRFVGLEDEDPKSLVTETLVRQITLNSTITSVHQKTSTTPAARMPVSNVTDIPKTNGTSTTPLSSKQTDTWTTSRIAANVTLGFGLANDTDTERGNTTAPSSNSTLSPQNHRRAHRQCQRSHQCTAARALPLRLRSSGPTCVDRPGGMRSALHAASFFFSLVICILCTLTQQNNTGLHTNTVKSS